MAGSTPKDIAGQTFGRLTAIEMAGKKGSRILWHCKCRCGGEKTVDGVRLRNGAVRSCGCLKREGNNKKHGQNARGKRTRTYNSWHHMRDRCTNMDSHRWEHYGGRGITVCERWAKFENFAADMGQCPPGHTIDRIDNNGNYEPGNCRWADAKTQSRNTRRNVYLTANGETLPIWEWAELLGTTSDTLNMRRHRGWTDDQIVNTPIGQN